MFRWIRRSDHPSRPNAMTCCFFSSFKTLLTLTEGIALASKSMSGTLLIVGRFSGDHVWPVLGVHRGQDLQIQGAPELPDSRGVLQCFQPCRPSNAVFEQYHNAADAGDFRLWKIEPGISRIAPYRPDCRSHYVLIFKCGWDSRTRCTKPIRIVNQAPDKEYLPRCGIAVSRLSRWIRGRLSYPNSDDHWAARARLPKGSSPACCHHPVSSPPAEVGSVA